MLKYLIYERKEKFKEGNWREDWVKILEILGNSFYRCASVVRIDSCILILGLRLGEWSQIALAYVLNCSTEACFILEIV